MDSLLNSDATTKTHIRERFFSSQPYSQVLKRQLQCVKEVSSDPDKAFFLVGEHAPTFTAGRSVTAVEIDRLKEKVSSPVESIDRGGLFMFHGPGQLTIYPIFKLKEHFRGPKDYFLMLSKAVCTYFKDHHEIELEFKDNGFWNKDKKVGFLGVRIKDGVCYHGLSINYYVDLDSFTLRSPCNVESHEVGNLFNSPLVNMFLKEEISLLCERIEEMFNAFVGESSSDEISVDKNHL